jgi:hypothetical protein
VDVGQGLRQPVEGAMIGRGRMRCERKPMIIISAALMAIAAVGAAASLAHPAVAPFGPNSPGVPDAGPNSSQTEVAFPQAAGKGDDQVRQAEPKLKDFVRVDLEGAPREDEKKLAEEVKKELERRQPQNPGRRKTFGTLSYRGFTPRNRDTHLLKQTGWELVIRGVLRDPDGWRAWVHVFAFLQRPDGNIAAASNKHMEVWRFKDGRLTLDEDFVDPLPLTQDPNYDPSQGLLEVPMIGRLPRPEEIRVPVHPFLVRTYLEGTPTEQEKALARQVEKVLSEKQPENPGRDRTFGKMVLVRRPPDGEPREWRLKRTGWSLLVRRVERIPGGWRATVYVYVQAATIEGGFATVVNNHIEIYSFRDGKLTLESDSVDPRWDPSKGLLPRTFPRPEWPDPAHGRPLGTTSATRPPTP